MKRFLAFGAILVVAGCGEQQLASHQTASGRPEAFFTDPDTAAVGAKLAGVCADTGILVQQVTPNQVVCGGTMQGDAAFLAQLAIGNSYSTPPTQNVRFTMIPYQGGTRVQAEQWIETQMAFGQINRAELNSGAQFNSVMNALVQAGGTPFGTPTPAPAPAA